MYNYKTQLFFPPESFHDYATKVNLYASEPKQEVKHCFLFLFKKRQTKIILFTNPNPENL